MKLKLKKKAGTKRPPEIKNLPAVPSVSGDGAIMVSAGKHARSAVLTVFETIGGVDAMAEWADKNKEAFYTKLFSKTITKEVENTKSDTIEDLLEAIDQEEDEAPIDALDAEFEDL